MPVSRKNPACAGCNVNADVLISVLYFRAAQRPSFLISAGSPRAHDRLCLSPKHLGLQAGLRHKPGVPGKAPTDLSQFAGGDNSCAFAFANAGERCVALCHPWQKLLNSVFTRSIPGGVGRVGTPIGQRGAGFRFIPLKLPDFSYYSSIYAMFGPTKTSIHIRY